MKKPPLFAMPLEDDLGEALRAELLKWPGVTMRPMMGCIAFCHGKRMLGCYVNRNLSEKKPWWMNQAGEPTLAWVRLRKTDVEQALNRRTIHHCRTGAKNWIEIHLASRKLTDEAIRWFDVAYNHPLPESSKNRRRK